VTEPAALLTIAQVAALLNVSRKTVWVYVRRGILPPARVIGMSLNGRRRFLAREVAEAIERLPVAPAGSQVQQPEAAR
jgi:excisionase family DNA binding protein